MYPSKCVRLTKITTLHAHIYREFSEKSPVIAKKTGTFVKLAKKPQRAPFMKNVFLGVFDTEMLAYPELDKEGLIALKNKLEPYKKFFEKNVDPKSISLLKIIPNEIMENCKNLGLFGQIIPTMYDGCDQTATETALISEVIAKDLDLALTLYSHNFLAVQALVSYGSPEQKEKYLPRLASGEWFAAFGISENTSSSDIGCISTTVSPSEDNPEHYLLNGHKRWVINGLNANLFIVSTRDSVVTYLKEVVPVIRVLLIERDSPGVTVTKSVDHLGLNASNICDIHFKDTPVHQNSFIGSQLQGFDIITHALNSGRYNLGGITSSLLKNLLNQASDFIISRSQSEKQLKDCEQIQDKVSDIARCIYALESMTYLTTGLLDTFEDQDCSLELAIIKVYSFTEGRRSLDLITELMGGQAFLNSEITQKYFRDFRTMEVFDGTVDVAKLFISLVGLQYAGEHSSDAVSKLRSPFQYPTYVLKRIFQLRKQYSDNPKLHLQLYEELHPSLISSANELEYCVIRLEYAVNAFLVRYGSDVVNQQVELMRLADAAVKIYAMTAVLGRSSRSYCIGLRNAETEIKYAIQICSRYKLIVRNELNDLIDGVVMSGDLESTHLGHNIFKHHGYYVEHPLERTF